MKKRSGVIVLALCLCLAFASVASAATVPVTPMSTIATDDVFDWAKYIITPLLGLAALGVGIRLAPRFIGQLKKALTR